MIRVFARFYQDIVDFYGQAAPSSCNKGPEMYDMSQTRPLNHLRAMMHIHIAYHRTSFIPSLG